MINLKLWLFTRIPHKHIWKTTRYNGITHSANERQCVLCNKYQHIPWENWLKMVMDNRWCDGNFEEYCKEKGK